MLLFENFNNAALPTALGLWAGGAKLELVSDAAQTYGGTGKSLKATYSAMAAPGGAQYPGGSLSLLPYNTNHVYIRFRAKMPQYKHGLKFVKVFGQNESGGYANTTFGLDYTGVESGTGSMYCASFGDGTGLANDTASIISFSGAGYPGRAAGLPGYAVSTPQNRNFAASDWGTGWHLFEFYVKFNSGTTAANEKNDGAVQVKIDGKVYVDAKGLFNRHYSNKPLDRIEILGWSQNSSIEELINGSWIRRELATPEFEIWYDNIEISLNGWGTSPL